MRVLLLPGADGTGVLFKPFINYLSKSQCQSIKLSIINLNRDKQGNFLIQELSKQAEYIERNFVQSTIHPTFFNNKELKFNQSKVVKLDYKSTNEAVIIIAESYSGLLAYELLKRQNLNIIYTVFVASFLSCPSKTASLAPLINPAYLKSALILLPDPIWGKMLFSHWQTAELRGLFIEAMNETPNDLLKQRLKIISKANVPSTVINVPCLYLQANNDNLVLMENIKAFKQLFSNFDTCIVEGTHFLMQTNPKMVLKQLLERKIFNL